MKNQHEPDPKESTFPPVWDEVIRVIKERDAQGQAKYHTRLKPFNKPITKDRPINGSFCDGNFLLDDEEREFLLIARKSIKEEKVVVDNKDTRAVD